MVRNEYCCNIRNSLKEAVPYEMNLLVEGACIVNSSSETFTLSDIADAEVIYTTVSTKTSVGSGLQKITICIVKEAFYILTRTLLLKNIFFFKAESCILCHSYKAL